MAVLSVVIGGAPTLGSIIDDADRIVDEVEDTNLSVLPVLMGRGEPQLLPPGRDLLSEFPMGHPTSQLSESGRNEDEVRATSADGTTGVSAEGEHVQGHTQEIDEPWLIEMEPSVT